MGEKASSGQNKGKRLALIGFTHRQGVGKIASALAWKCMHMTRICPKSCQTTWAILHKNIDVLFERCTHICALQ